MLDYKYKNLGVDKYYAVSLLGLAAESLEIIIPPDFSGNIFSVDEFSFIGVDKQQLGRRLAYYAGSTSLLQIYKKLKTENSAEVNSVLLDVTSALEEDFLSNSLLLQVQSDQPYLCITGGN
jgi:hypothetical protein